MNRARKVLSFKNQELVNEAKLGNESAFQELYWLYRNQVYRSCLRFTRSIPDAEDLTQEIFMQVKRKLNGFRGESSFSTWLYRVSFNATMIFLRKRRITEIYSEPSEMEKCATRRAPMAPSCGYEPVRRVALKRAIASLPTRRRSVLILHDVNGLTHREVALHLGIRTGTSKAQLHHAHVTLRSILGASF